MMWVVVAMCATAEDRLYIEDLEIAAGETQSMEILLDNETVFTAFQCDIYLPEGLTVSNFKLTNRKHNSHTLSVTVQPDGAQRLLSYSLQLKPYSGNSGALVTFDLTASQNFIGPAVIALRHVMFSNLNGDEIPLNDEECSVTVPVSVLPGDVDSDGNITIGDVADLIDLLLKGNAAIENCPAADVDGDGHITIGDVADLIDMLLRN